MAVPTIPLSPALDSGTDRPAGSRGLAVLLFSQGALITTSAALGPLALDVLHYRTSDSGLAQILGTDLTAVVLVAPLCVWIGRLAWRGHPAAPVLALAPAVFTVYVWTQLLAGNEFGRLPGNVEWFFPLFLAVVGVGGAVAARASSMLRHSDVPSWGRWLERATGVLLLVVAAFVVVGIHLPSLIDALRANPSGYEVLSTPNAFWVVKAWDLGVVVPAALVLGIGLLRRRSWARTPAAAVLGGYVLLGCSVAAMGWSMLRSGAPDASVGLAMGASAIAAAGAGYAVALYRPLFRAAARTPARTG
jgi:hypothetical protein